ncbi:MAG: hypothetical protein IJK25_00480, partial [Firmicutes bacterium]|nr:hypothetical protein [Bacillota bacterium]
AAVFFITASRRRACSCPHLPIFFDFLKKNFKPVSFLRFSRDVYSEGEDPFGKNRRIEKEQG